MTKKIAVIVGSLRKESYNRKIAKTLIGLHPKLDLQLTNIGDLALYNEDTEPTPPDAWVHFRKEILASDGVLFITPEYNRSIPAALKNAVDVGSRPYGKSVWNNKPTAIISSSQGVISGFGANQHLRQSLSCLNMPCLPGPEVYIADVAKLFDDKGIMTNTGTKEFLSKVLESYATWIDRVTS